MNGFRKFTFAVAAGLPLISVVLIAVAWLRVNDMAPPAWFVPHLILTDVLPGVLIPANAPLCFGIRECYRLSHDGLSQRNTRAVWPRCSGGGVSHVRGVRASRSARKRFGSAGMCIGAGATPPDFSGGRAPCSRGRHCSEGRERHTRINRSPRKCDVRAANRARGVRRAVGEDVSEGVRRNRAGVDPCAESWAPASDYR
jgi:hypothetical protein